MNKDLANKSNSFSNRIFLCHSDEDSKKVKNIYSMLQKKGYFPWLDKNDLLPGQNFETEIKRVIQNCRCVMVFFSRKSVEKRGFIQREFKLTLKALEEIPSNQIFIIPVKLEDCEVPYEFSNIQWVNLAEDNAWTRINSTLEIIFGRAEIYESNAFLEIIIDDIESVEDRNIDNFLLELELILGAKNIKLDSELSNRLFFEWKNAAQRCTKDEPLLFRAWLGVLYDILYDNNFDSRIIQYLRKLQEDDAVFLVQNSGTRFVRVNSADKKFRSEHSNFYGIIEDSKFKNGAFLASGVFSLIFVPYITINLFDNMGSGFSQEFFVEVKYTMIYIFSLIAVLMVYNFLVYKLVPNYELTWLGKKIVYRLRDDKRIFANSDR